MEVPRGFTRCDECEGTGDVCECERAERDPHPQPVGHPGVFCPSCSGSGLRPTEKLREEATAVGRSKLWDTRTDEVVDAVLRKVAEHIGEGR